MENENQRSDIIVSGSTATWEMRVEGDFTGTFTGTFKFRCFLSPVQQIAAGREQRELLGSNAGLASRHESFLAYALTQLKYRVLEAPPFWTSATGSGYAGDLFDENVIEAVLDAAISAELKYKTSLQEKKNASVKKAKAAGEDVLSGQEKDEDDLDEIDGV